MLELKNIKKEYLSGSDKVEALKGVSISFRESEFVSILGPSGCGKTTMLNIVGGLDQYTSGDLIINGKSTKDFHDSDWDGYRNHSIGFVFQSYNLIPHQSVLANVELALTLSGVSKAERRRKAIGALEKVGLKDQIKKRPNQLSGGQMQRVAIARALVNDPDILLADEPTGALDSVTSIQIMDLLKEIARDKLVIMVTHNPALAEEYSTRIIKLLDGTVVDDTNPYNGKEEKAATAKKKEKKPSMSFFTALSLSMNNLMTKKGRTILTSFAGSIGIIGIALILSLSAGINAFIYDTQEETLSSAPISIMAESRDMSALMTSLMGINQKNEANRHNRDAVYSSSVMNEMVNSLINAEVETNNLTLFKEYLDSDEEIRQYITNLQYSYNLDLSVYTKNVDGKIIESDAEETMKAVFAGIGVPESTMSGMSATTSAMSGGSFASIKLWQEMLPDENGNGISPLLKEQYDVVYGNWPQNYNEVVLVVNENNELSDVVLSGLGLLSTDKLIENMIATQKGEELDTTVRSWSYEEICEKEYKIFLPFDLYQKNASGGYTHLSETEKGIDFLYGSNHGVSVKICGIIRLNEDANSGMLTGALGYTADLTRHLLEKTKNNELIAEQKRNPETDILLNLPFIPEDFVDYSNEEKCSMILTYLQSLSDEEKAKIYVEIASTPSQEYLASALAALEGMERSELEASVMQALAAQEQDGTDLSSIEGYIKEMSNADLLEAVKDAMEKQVTLKYAEGVKAQLAAVPQNQLAMMLSASLADPAGYTADQLLSLYEAYMPATHSESTLEDNLELLGLVDEKSPSVIHIYTDTFEKKDKIAELIKIYNSTKKEEDQIEYTDLFAIIMSSIATIINAISYVLIAFVSISLVVSSIMIGIITYISVLERTKEIGILRAIGASKKDVSRVFNAESIIEGFAAGLFGIGITLLLLIPANVIIQKLTEIPTLVAHLPPYGYLLILVSVFLSFIAGLVPSRFAAKKDPVEALRTE